MTLTMELTPQAEKKEAVELGSAMSLEGLPVRQPALQPSANSLTPNLTQENASDYFKITLTVFVVVSLAFLAYFLRHSNKKRTLSKIKLRKEASPASAVSQSLESQQNETELNAADVEQAFDITKSPLAIKAAKEIAEREKNKSLTPPPVSTSLAAFPDSTFVTPPPSGPIRQRKPISNIKQNSEDLIEKETSSKISQKAVSEEKNDPRSIYYKIAPEIKNPRTIYENELKKQLQSCGDLEGKRNVLHLEYDNLSLLDIAIQQENNESLIKMIIVQLQQNQNTLYAQPSPIDTNKLYDYISRYKKLQLAKKTHPLYYPYKAYIEHILYNRNNAEEIDRTFDIFCTVITASFNIIDQNFHEVKGLSSPLTAQRQTHVNNISTRLIDEISHYTDNPAQGEEIISNLQTGIEEALREIDQDQKTQKASNKERSYFFKSSTKKLPLDAIYQSWNDNFRSLFKSIENTQKKYQERISTNPMFRG